jgi:[CysO sulfur-carrier protein]-S-L-cysteine hydrolase
VVIPAELREELRAHAREALPNEACGVLAIRDGRAERYYRCINLDESPYRFSLSFPDPALPFELEDAGYEIGIFHTHPQTEPRPSKTDIANIGEWEGAPFVIMRADTGEIRFWRIRGGEVSEQTTSE